MIHPRFSLLAALLMATLLSVAPAEAVTVNWGDVSDPNGDVIFRDVTEDNGESSTLFDDGDGPDASGNRLVFNPQNFQSQSNGGADLLDSTLTTVIEAKPGESIGEIFIEEVGDYTLSGLSSGEAVATANAFFFWRVLEVDGVAVSLPLEMAELDVTDDGLFEKGADLINDGIWSGSLLIDVAEYLADQLIDGVATAVSLRFDNTLSTAADGFSNAFIKKKGVDIVVTPGDSTRPYIPEPTTGVMGLMATVALAAARRRR